MQRGSVMFSIAGVDNAQPRFVARRDLIQIFSGMGNADLCAAHIELLSIVKADDQYTDMEAGDLTRLLEIHTRAVNALQALLALRDPDELVEAHLP